MGCKQSVLSDEYFIFYGTKKVKHEKIKTYFDLLLYVLDMEPINGVTEAFLTKKTVFYKNLLVDICHLSLKTEKSFPVKFRINYQI